MLSSKTFLLLAAGNGFFAVILGAFGAHALKGSVSENLFSAYQTGVQYQMYHALAMLGVGLLGLQGVESRWLSVAGMFFVMGVLLFSGSLYGLALGGPRWLGPITPLGGLLLIVGWCSLFVAVLKVKI